MTAATMEPVKLNGEARHAAVAAAREAAAAGVPLTGKALGEQFGRSARWGRERVAEAKASATNGLPVPVAAAVVPRQDSGEQQVSDIQNLESEGTNIRPDVPRDAERRAWHEAAVVLVVALVAAAASYGHMVEVALLAGEPSWIAYLFPITVDGLVLAALRRGETGRWWLALGLVVSVGANVLAQYPALAADAGPVVSAWPPLALYGTHRLLRR